MFDNDLSGLDADATLAFVGRSRAEADRLETAILAAAAHWADLHSDLDGDRSGVSLPGMEKLIRLGGDGTPQVAEFAPAELGAELAMSPFAAARLIADALDLRHRLPRLWARVLAGEVKPWIGRKTAEATRNVPAEVAAVVDRRVARWAHSLSWGRLEAIIAAAEIAADPAAAEHKARVAAERQGVWVGQSSDHGIKDIFIRTEAANAIWFDACIDRVADSLSALGDTDPKGIRRAKAVGVLAQPQRALDLFDSAATSGGRQAAAGVGVDARPPATLYIHLSEDSFTRDGAGVARFEGVGPDVFPYATNTTRSKQADHTDPYLDPGQGGPPGQTRLDNLAPMVTFHHRIKTHGRWQVRQVFNGVFVWRSPHGRLFLVDHTGTQPINNAA